ncbi:MAG: response regulator transcription factor [Sphingobacteriales bacterium]|nr:MAG: response regulator transcription factor [Sphingobacteriales bacterium]
MRGKKLQAKEIGLFLIGVYDEFHGLLETFLKYKTNVEIRRHLTPKDHFDLNGADEYHIIVVDAKGSKYGFTDDLQLLRLVMEAYPDKKVIAFTDKFEQQTMIEVSKIGAAGYYFRGAIWLEDISACINLVYKGETAYNYE